jgi:hypothetical protein
MEILNLVINFILEYHSSLYVALCIFAVIIIGLILKPAKKLILAPELIPYTMHGKNVRAVLTAEDWQSVARISYKEAGHRCEICNARGRLECHEIWKFNDKKLVQSLIGLITLCPDCHRVKHIGLARKMGWYGDALDHMAKVNGISKKKAKQYIEYAEMEVKKRKEEYDLDLTYLNNYKKEAGLPRKYKARENDNCANIKGNW